MRSFSAADVTESYVSADGYLTRYLQAGDQGAPPVVLLHDGAWGGCSTVTWGSVIPALASSYRVLAPDLLGFGGTDKVVFTDRSPYEFRIAHLLAFLDAVAPAQSVHVVGNSFGGSMALRCLAPKTGHRVRSVVSVAGTGGPWRTPLAHEQLARWDGTEEDLRRVVALLIEADAPRFADHCRTRYDWARVPGHYRAAAAPSTRLPAPLQCPPRDDPWPEELRRAEQPVLLVAGARDVLLEQGWTERLLRVLPRACAHVLDGRHAPNIDRPDELAEVLLAFLGDVEDRATRRIGRTHVATGR